MTDVGVQCKLSFPSPRERTDWLSTTSEVRAALSTTAAAKMPCFAMTEGETEWGLEAIGPIATWTELADLLRAVMRAAVGRGEGRLQVFDFLHAPIEPGAFEGLVIDVDGEGARERIPDRQDQRRGIIQSLDLQRSVMTGAYEDGVFEELQQFAAAALLSILSPKRHRDAVSPSLRERMKPYGAEWVALAEERGFTVGTGDPLPPRFVYLADRMEDIYVLVRSSEWSFELLTPAEARERMRFIEECARVDPGRYQRFVGMLPLFGMDLDCLVIDEYDGIHLVSKSVDRIETRFAVGFGALLDKFIVESSDDSEGPL